MKPRAPTPVIVCGLSGRMGTLIAQEAQADERFSLAGAIVRPGSPHEGADLGAYAASAPTGIRIAGNLKSAAEGLTGNPVVIDFTTPSSLQAHLDSCLDLKLPLLIGTTGLETRHHEKIEAAARDIPVLLAPNTSLGANLLAALTETAARALPDADIEIIELHHRGKKDSPSGTAVMLGKAAANARAQTWETSATLERSGQAPRQPGEIGAFGVRGGTVAGEHTVYLLMDDERLELTHRAQDRAIFAKGALIAARFLDGRSAGLYAMKDVLGL